MRRDDNLKKLKTILLGILVFTILWESYVSKRVDRMTAQMNQMDNEIQSIHQDHIDMMKSLSK